MKKLIIEILIILVLSILFGLFYNFVSNDPLPLIYKPKEIKTLNDSTFMSLLSPLKDNLNLDTSKEKGLGINNYKDSILNKTKKQIVDKKIPYFDNGNVKVSEKKSEITVNKKNGNLLKGNVTFELIKKYMNDSRVQLIDAREPELYAKGKIGNAINIFPYQEQSDYFKKLRDVPDGKTIIVYCEGGKLRFKPSCRK